MKQKDHLPFFGIGPYFVGMITILTAVGVFLSCKGYLDSGIIPALKTPMLILGILIVVLGAFIWGYAFFIDKIDDAIKENRLYTEGIYAWVRNPLYVGWMFICIGVSLFPGNLWLLVLPFIFWGLMTRILSRKGWFTPPFETFGSLKARLEKGYWLDEYHKEGSIVYFKATKR